MKVAVIIDSWFPFIGGGQINAWEISKNIAMKGVKIEIITRNLGKHNLKTTNNLKIIKLGFKTSSENTLTKILFIYQSFKYVKRHEFDLIHAHAFLPGITAKLLMIFKRIPAIFTVHGTSINTKLNNLVLRWLEKFILNDILYSSQITVSQDFLRLKNINKFINYIPNGVSILEFDNINVRKMLNPTLLFVGRLHSQKNITILIESINIVTNKIPDLTLLIVGKGPEESLLKKKVKDLNLTNNIKFLGEIKGKHLIKIYKSSHIFVLPSIYEGQPLTLLEAWAAKLPVIVTNTGDLSFIVKNNENGYLINNCLDEKEIAQLIIAAFKNKRLTYIGKNGYDLIKDKYLWHIASDYTFKVYKKVLQT